MNVETVRYIYLFSIERIGEKIACDDKVRKVDKVEGSQKNESR